MAIVNSSELLKEQLAEYTKNLGDKRVKAVEPSASTAIEYNAILQEMVRMIKKDIDTQVIPLLRKLAPEYQNDTAILTTDSFVDDIISGLEGVITKWTASQVTDVKGAIAKKFVNQANGINRKRFNKSMKSFGLDLFGDSPSIDDYLSEAIYDNINLISGLTDDYLSGMQSIVMTNVRAGGRPSAIVEQLQKKFKISENRAKLIARDQTAKINGDLVAKRSQASGFQHFQWIDADDERVRARHIVIDNKVTAYGKGIYRWDNPPLSSTGTPIIPSQDYNCRCVARPVTQSEIDQNKSEGLTRKGVYR